jgi:ribosomal protein S6
MQRTYEVMFIVRPDILDEDLDKLIAGLEGNITQGGGSIKSLEKLGRRKLAYTVKKFNDGNYVLLTILADGSPSAWTKRRSEWPKLKPSAPHARSSAPSRRQRLRLPLRPHPRRHRQQKRPAPKVF